MYYLLNQPDCPYERLAELPERNCDLAAYLKFRELEHDAEQLHIEPEVLDLCRERTLQNTLGSFERYLFAILSLPDPERISNERDLIGLYIDAEKILIIDLYDRDRSTSRAFKRALQLMGNKQNLGRFFALFVKEITKGHYRYFRVFQEETAQLEHSLWDTDDDNDQRHYQREFSRISHQLLLLHSYYEEVVDLLSEMEENETQVLDSEDLAYVRQLLGRMEHYSGNMQYCREYLAQVREAYQSQLDLKLNATMKIFTVMTSVFLPLSLLVGWYGMNFKNMPELDWEYGYIAVIASSIVITALILWYFKRKKLL
ncbi:MAG: CorA family divalent cation transporter [Eubacteriales bacterium]|nr:CorA family divalent cation transporter [Eubacteriales bacterium]